MYYCVTLQITKSVCHKFENFLNKLNLTIESNTQKNQFLTVAIGDFNVRSSEWWTDDKTTQELVPKNNPSTKSFISNQLSFRSFLQDNFQNFIFSAL